MKRLLFLMLPICAWAQLPYPTVVNSDGATFRGRVNSNFGWLYTNKSDVTHNHTGVYALLSHAHIIGDVTGLQTALDLKAPLASPTFTGTVTISGTVLRGGGTSLPGTCAVGDQYFLTTGTTGNYQCTAPNTWTLPGGGAGTAPYSCAVSGVSSIACTHNLGTSTPWVACYDGAGNMLGSTGATIKSVTAVVATSSNVATLTFDGATTGTCVISTGSMGPAATNGTNGTNGTGYLATSTTSLTTAGSGAKSFTTQAGLAYSAGARARATSAGTGEYMEGVVTSYAGTTLVATMDHNSGTGTHADWNLNLAGDVGATGPSGPAGGGGGDVLGPATNTDAYLPLWNGANSKTLKDGLNPAPLKTRTCEIHMWGSGALGVLQDSDDEPASCMNKTGATLTITSVECRADAGSPTVMVTVTGGSNVLSGNLTAGTATFAAGSLSGTPTQAANATLDVNIVAAGGTAKGLICVVGRTL